MSTDEAVAADPDGGPAEEPLEPLAQPPAAGAPWPGSRRRRALQWVVPALVLALLDAGGLAWWHHRDATPAVPAFAATTTRTLAVSPATLKENVSATGTLTPTVDDTFGFAVSGVVTHVEVKAGQTVKAGQVLATVGTTALAASLAQAKATVAADRATLAADTADSASSTQIAADNATITEAAAAVATAAANVAATTLRAPVAGEITTFGLAVGDTVTGSGSASTGSSGSAAGGGTGTAAGSSSGVSSGAGSSDSTASGSSSSSSDVEIVGTTSWEVATTVDDTDIGNLAVGDEATITLSLSSSSGSTTTTGGGGFGGFGGGAGGFANGGGTGTGGTTSGSGTTGTGTTGAGATGSGTASTATTTTVYGTVTSIGLVPSTTTGVAAYPVVVTVTGTSPDLFSGMSATAAITYRQLTNVLAVPTTAITTSGSTHTVEVSSNGKTTKTTVQVGAVVGTETQIVSGLSSGQEIVLPAVRGATGTTGTGRFAGTGTGGFGGTGTGGFAGRAGGGGNG